MSLPETAPMADSTWKEIWYDGWFAVMASLFTGAFSYRSSGSQHVPRQGPLLIVANHQSFLDPILVGLAVRRHLSYLARKSLYRHHSFAWFIRTLNAVAVDQEGFARDGLMTVIDLLKKGRGVTIFPEGERTMTGAMNPLRPGIHLILRKAPCQILPVGIAGAYDAWPRWRAYPTPAPLFLPPTKATIAVAIGRPFCSSVYDNQPRDAVLQDLFRHIHDAHAAAEKLRRK